ncbi:hypothetical protein Tco_0174273 [Tanacetum coccineum]
MKKKTKEWLGCKIAKQFNKEEFDRARQEQEVVAEADQAHDIDWSDPAVLRYHALQNRSFSVAENIKSKQVEEEIVQQEYVVAKQVMIESSKKAGGRLKRKVSNARKDKDKRQKMHDDPEKITLKEYVKAISDLKEVISVIPLAVKSPIVSWKSYCKGDVGYYEIHTADESYKTYIFFNEMLNNFDREDLIVLYRLLNEKYASTRPGFDDLMLWGDLKIMFEPDSDDEVWKNHQHQELIEWKLYDSCRVHFLH